MFLILFGRLAQFLLVMVTMRVATQLLSPEEMGRMSLVVSITAFFAVLLVYHVGMFINRRLHAWNEHGQVRRYFGYYWGYLVLVSLVTALCLVMADEANIAHFPMSIIWVLVLVCGSLLFNSANQTLIPALNLLEFRGWFIGLTLLTVAAGFIFSLILVLHFGPKAQYWLLGQILAQAVLALVGGRILFGKVMTKAGHTVTAIRPEQIGTVFAFAWPVAISVGLNWVQTQGYRFLMEGSAGLVALGLFVTGYGVSAGLISAIETILTTYFQPKFYKKISNGTRDEQSLAWNEYARVMLPSLLLTGMFIAALAPEITRILLGPAFQPAAAFVVWGAMAEVLRAAAGVMGLVAHARMKTRLLLFPHAIGAMIAVLLVWWWLPFWGGGGVGAGLAMAGVGTLVPMYFFMRREITMSVAMKRLILSALFGAVIFLLADLVRWGIGGSKSVLAAMFILAVVGLVFLAFQLIMVSEYMRANRGEA